MEHPDPAHKLSANLYDIPLFCIQWKTPNDGQRNCPKHVEFHSKNKFEKLVHLVGFISRNLSRCTVTWTPNSKMSRESARISVLCEQLHHNRHCGSAAWWASWCSNFRCCQVSLVHLTCLSTPDLAGLDYFFWGYITSKLQETCPANTDYLKQWIWECVQGNCSERLQRLKIYYPSWLQDCTE